MKENSIAGLDWPTIIAGLDREGYALLPNFLDAEQARALAASVRIAAAGGAQLSLDSFEPERDTVWRLVGSLPAPLAAWQDVFYESLAPLANRWNDALGIAERFPLALQDFRRENGEAGNGRPQTILSRLVEGDFQALHQNSGGTRDFPLQLVILLSEPGTDFTGGEFVMTEQRPRMQSRPMVLPMRCGDAAIITVAQKPFKGATGYYRVRLKHAVSRVRSGERLGLELLFHD